MAENTALTVGQPAPDFTAPISTGGEVSLDDLKGSWTILYFYPKDNTKGCAQEACEFKESLPDFEGADAKIYGVSPDSLKSHEKFITKYELPFPLISDEEQAMLEAYGVWQEKKMYGKTYMGVVRTTVILDADNVVRHVWTKVKVKGHVEEVLATLKELQG